MTATTERIRLAQVRDYRFDMVFDESLPVVATDEPPPLGTGTGPSPVQMLCGAVGNCLAASLLFALRKFGQSPEPIASEVVAEVGRNAGNRLRVLSLAVTLRLGVPASRLEHLERVLDAFEDFCTVTGSVRAAVPVSVTVEDSEGKRLK